jgi:calnexin
MCMCVHPCQEIDDPNDKKPSDWVDIAEIDDETATKPDDWDEDAPEFIVDQDAVKPAVKPLLGP